MESRSQNNSPENGVELISVLLKGNKPHVAPIIIGLAVAIVGLGVWFIVASTSQKKAVEEAIAAL